MDKVQEAGLADDVVTRIETLESDKSDKTHTHANYARAYSANLSSGSGEWTTAEFVAWLTSKGCFDQPFWVCKMSWSYGGNRAISDTAQGNLHLAGCVVEVIGRADVYTIRVTTPPTAPADHVTNAVFTYTNHGAYYSPSWRRDYNTLLPPPSIGVGQTYKSKTGNYLSGAQYRNTGTKPVFVSARCSGTKAQLELQVDGITVAVGATINTSGTQQATVGAPVPADSTFKIIVTHGTLAVVELS